MLIVGECRKCGETVKIDIGDKTVAEVIKTMKAWDSFECPGHHAELCSPVPHFWDVENWKIEEGSAPSEEEWLAKESEKRELLTTEQMTSKYDVIGFGFGACCASPKGGGEKVYLDWLTSPAGRRYYYRLL